MKSGILCLLAFMGIASQARAEDVQAVKKSGGQQIAENLYGNIETRLTTFRAVDENDDVQSNRIVYLRPKLGTKIMNDKLDLGLTMPVANKQYSAKSDREQPEAETSLGLFSNDIVSIDIASFHYLQTNEADYDGYADFDITLKKDFDQLSFAKIETSFLIEGEANLATKSLDATVTRRERSNSTALSEDEDAAAPTPEQKETNKALNLYPLVYINPTAIPGLALGVGSFIETIYSPKYVQVISDDGATSLKDDGYSVTRRTQMRYTVKFQVNSDVAISNQLRQNVGGYLEEGVKDAIHLENRTSITMNLF